MGIDFAIDNNPRYRLTGVVGSPKEDEAWKGREFTEELVDAGELGEVIERFGYEGPINLTIETVPLEPPLRDSVIPEAPHWAYSGFNRFRKRISATADIDLDLMQGFFDKHAAYERYYGYGSEPVGCLDPGVYKERIATAEKRWTEEARTWDEIDSGLVPLLDHSDCDGYLSPEECAKVAPALRQALRDLQLTPYHRFEDGRDYDVESGEALANMMDFCAEYKRRLVFC